MIERRSARGQGRAQRVHRSERSERRPLTVGSARSCYPLLSATEVFVFLWGFFGCLATGSEAEGAWGDAGWE